MANEIYNSTWWGNSLDTAGSVGSKPDLFGSQFKMQDRIIADSGVLEAKKCVSDDIFHIGITTNFN
tara:strand:- start:8 stop:205 length:198 start_codon:yes stop_codon:yes gene_type:complete